MATTTESSIPVLELNYSSIETNFLTDTFLFHHLKSTKLMGEFFSRFLALIGLILLAPIFLVVSVLIKLNMGGEVFYLQTRVGKDGIPFSIYKFRTMVADAEKASGPVLATKNDPRITTLGKFLRASHVDEFPQLINVLKGEMTFVGPRPERPEFVSVFENEIPNYSRRREVKPGITGLAQICLPYDATAEQKIVYDVFYINNKNSIVFKMMICYYTFLKMIHFNKFI